LRDRLSATAARNVPTATVDPAPAVEGEVPSGSGGATATKTKVPATTRVVDPQAYSRSHPPRPRKQGKKR
jgi:hypothetical protein